MGRLLAERLTVSELMAPARVTSTVCSRRGSHIPGIGACGGCATSFTAASGGGGAGLPGSACCATATRSAKLPWASVTAVVDTSASVSGSCAWTCMPTTGTCSASVTVPWICSSVAGGVTWSASVRSWAASTRNTSGGRWAVSSGCTRRV